MKKIFIFVFTLALSSMVNASVTIDALDAGWYRGSEHFTNNQNYFAGKSNFLEMRNFFVFDLSMVGEVGSATLRLSLRGGPTPLYGYFSTDPFETYALSDMTTDINSLLDGSAGLTAFNDMGSGISYGSVDITEGDEYSFIEIVLNQAALDSISSSNELWAIGGSVTTLQPGSDDEGVFGISTISHGVKLDLTPVPIPSGLWLYASGIAGICRMKSSCKVP